MPAWDASGVRLEVEGVSGSEVQCRVVVGGEIRSRKGVNLPAGAREEEGDRDRRGNRRAGIVRRHFTLSELRLLGPRQSDPSGWQDRAPGFPADARPS
jgi:hypothetical protein